jgi:hypothetical protein
MLVDAIRQTPPELQYLVDDGFNCIVSTTTNRRNLAKTPDGKFKVTLEVEARKMRADGNGAETPMPLDDYIEIGVFSGRKIRKTALPQEGRSASPTRHSCSWSTKSQP